MIKWIIVASIILTVGNSIVIRKMINLMESMNEEIENLKRKQRGK